MERERLLDIAGAVRGARRASPAARLLNRRAAGTFMGGRGRRVGWDLIAAQAGPLFDAISRAARRAGLNRSCLPDL